MTFELERKCKAGRGPPVIVSPTTAHPHWLVIDQAAVGITVRFDVQLVTIGRPITGWAGFWFIHPGAQRWNRGYLVPSFKCFRSFHSQFFPLPLCCDPAQRHRSRLLSHLTRSGDGENVCPWFRALAAGRSTPPSSARRRSAWGGYLRRRRRAV